ncbi:hypothetical protein RRG08_015278 [Elysia crispata]|uniref:Uncharacterized protein n=1 Tax=Elysia crispata TaxID=231223 RepID=A0AAE1AU52_9GAST|nr:hypothetical protein RRG08_015278 [Elysia crispata]
MSKAKNFFPNVSSIPPRRSGKIRKANGGPPKPSSSGKRLSTTAKRHPDKTPFGVVSPFPRGNLVVKPSRIEGGKSPLGVENGYPGFLQLINREDFGGVLGVVKLRPENKTPKPPPLRGDDISQATFIPGHGPRSRPCFALR